jgi:high-affinity iron transporter
MLSRLGRLAMLFGLLLLPLQGVSALHAPPSQAAETIRAGLVQAQLALKNDPEAAARLVEQAHSAYEEALAGSLGSLAPGEHERALGGFDSLNADLAERDASGFAAARSQVWTAILAGSYQIVETSLRNGDGETARLWLLAREFRTATRFSRPNADATLSVDGFIQGTVAAGDALLSVRADLLDTYQARLVESLRALAAADASGFPARRAELAALAEGYFLILAPAYGEQRGAGALSAAEQDFAALRAAALHGLDLSAPLQRVDAALNNFRAAPLSPSERARRAGQLLRFIYLVPVEYGRGVVGGRVTRDFEIQEAITFHTGAYAAFSDLQDLLDARDHEKTARVKTLFDVLAGQLTEASRGVAVADPDQIQSSADEITALLTEVMPVEWAQGSTQGDFDVIASMLDQMQSALRNGEYDMAESSRLEAYAVMETGPEARLMVFAPEMKVRLEDLFWNGQGGNKGLAYLIKHQASLQEVDATRAELDAVLGEAQTLLGASSAPAAVGTSAGLIVFREGLEAVVILASLMSSMKRAAERRYRTPMWIGTGLAILATVLTWLLARGVLQSLARYGEKLEAVVSLIAIGVLLLILNWFFHKTYWTSWIASFHARKRQLITGEAGLWLGLITLGFTSIYREGFEIVLFLQSLVLEAGSGVVLTGVAAGLLAVLLVGLITFRLQRNLPYKDILIITGILMGGVLLQMVGATAHAMQVVGWLTIHVIPSVSLPYWLGIWFGIYPTWEGIALQACSAAFVIGSYYLAEWLDMRRIQHAPAAASSIRANSSQA